MERRKLGRTGSEVTILALGGCGLGMISQEEADKAIQTALEAGINMLDIAPSYGEAENRLHSLVSKNRSRFFLAEKTMERTKEGAWAELHQSMERLGTNHFDSYQFHAVPSLAELDQIMGPGGAMEAFQEAKETGLIDYIGLTGHDDIRVHIKALEMFDFDTILLPVTVASKIDPHPTNDFETLLKMARDRNVGVVAIKAIQKQRWGDSTHKYHTWYEPLDNQEAVDKTLWYTLSQEGVTTVPLSCDIRLWPMIIDAAERYHKLDDEELAEILGFARDVKISPLFPAP